MKSVRENEKEREREFASQVEKNTYVSLACLKSNRLDAVFELARLM